MYWPVAPAKTLHHPGAPAIRQLVRNRKGTLFATLSRDEVGVWDVRPIVRIASLARSEGSISKYGENTGVCWAHDGRSIVVLTSTHHMITYTIHSTGLPAFSHAPTPDFPPGPGEGEPMGGIVLEHAGVSRVDARCTSLGTASKHLLVATHDALHGARILRVPWPIPEGLRSAGQAPGRGATVSGPGEVPPLDGTGEEQFDVESWDLCGERWARVEGEQDDVRNHVEGDGDEGNRVGAATDVHVAHLGYARTLGLHTLVLSDGRGFVLQFRPTSALPGAGPTARSPDTPHTYLAAAGIAARVVFPLSREGPLSGTGNAPRGKGPAGSKATAMVVNPKFGLVAVGADDGAVHMASLPAPPYDPKHSHTCTLKQASGDQSPPGAVTSMTWTSDGYALAVGYERGWAVWSVQGRLLGWGLAGGTESEDASATDGFMRGVDQLFWTPGSLELVMLSRAAAHDAPRLFVLPFAKSSNTSQQTPDSARYALLQLDDRLLVYRGADQPDMSVINPESDVWRPVKYPPMYIAANWPIRYTSVSADGKLLAVAGRFGLSHYSALSGRWKLFRDEAEEREMTVRGGMLWFHHVLIAAVETDTGQQLRLYSRDLELVDAKVLHRQDLPSPVVVMSLFNNSLLVYTADNTLYHFLVEVTVDSILLNPCGSISFRGIVAIPQRVRGMSWMIPPAQRVLGDPVHDLMVATIILLVDGRLVLLRPRKAGNNEVRYDMQVLADHIESYWTHLSGIDTLENSLWGYDGSSVRVWLDALTVEATSISDQTDAYHSLQESVKFELDFYPLSILMDKGVIIGADHEKSERKGLPFTLFKIASSTHLFLPSILQYHLRTDDVSAAVAMAICYEQLVYFGHALEIALYRVLDEVESSEADKRSTLQAAPTDKAELPESSRTSVPSHALTSAIEFLDYFPQSLDVVVGCARKIEMDRWPELFAIAGDPHDLFELCIGKKLLKTAASYLLVMHTKHPNENALKDTIRLLNLALTQPDTELAKDLLRFLRGIDATGDSLSQALLETGLS